MNLYEFEGKELFKKHSIAVPRGVVVRRGDNIKEAMDAIIFHDNSTQDEQAESWVVKAQVLSGKRGKNNGIRFCATESEVQHAVEDLFSAEIRGQYVAAVRIEEKIDIVQEHYLSITYDTNKKKPVLVYSAQGGMDIEDVPEEKIKKILLDSRCENVFDACGDAGCATLLQDIPFVQELWSCFLHEDTRLVEINPLVRTSGGQWIAADAKIAIDDDAFYRHESWKELEPRTMMGRPATEREVAAKKIDEGEKYYQGTAGKYIELDGDIGLILNGGGASIANMDALNAVGLAAANYTEYSGNPPREKVYELTKVVLSKPGLHGLWVCGVVSNFTNVKETFLGMIDAFDEVKPRYPIVIRRDGPEGEEGRQLVEECAKRNGLHVKIFGKETSMGDTAKVLADMVAHAV